MDTNNNGSFDKLVAGLTKEDRVEMLNKLQKNAIPAVQFVEYDKNDDYENITLHVKYKNESFFYKLFLWFRCFLKKRKTEEVYNSDLIGNIAKQVNREYPCLINHHAKVLDSIFYDRLVGLKEAAEFFKPHFAKVDERPGDFYVFLCSVLVPDLFESINSKVDPFTLSFETEPSNEVRNSLLKKLDDSLKDMNAELKGRLYSAVSAVNWLEHFSRLPFLHFTSQFTNVTGAAYTCYYKNAREDYNYLASVFSDIQTVESEVLESIILFSSKFSDNKNVEKEEEGKVQNFEDNIKAFVIQANEYFASIQMFLSSVPIVRIGKIINDNFDWVPEPMEGVESWFKIFRSSWRKIVDIRWNAWIVERRKNLLCIDLKDDFKLSDFPLLKYRPWESLWTRVPFTSELAGGFLAWFASTYYEKILAVLNVVVMEGIFINSENRSIYSEGLNSFVQGMSQIIELQESLGPEGDYGLFFEESVNNKIRSFQIQSKIDSMISRIEVSVHDCIVKFINGSQMMEKIFVEIFDSTKSNHQEVLQNLGTIKGLKNREWRESLLTARKLLKKGIYYVSELETIETNSNI